MTYSCAIFKDLDGDLQRAPHDPTGSEALPLIGTTATLPLSSSPSPETDELQEAQLRKLAHIIKKLDLRPGHRLLEIGSGWGSMAIAACQSVPSQDLHVDTITLSVHQQTLARQRIREAGLQDKITVHLVDYRALPKEWEGAFDRFVSVEMVEAVGREFLDGYWSVVDWALKRAGGIGVVQSITIPEA